MTEIEMIDTKKKISTNILMFLAFLEGVMVMSWEVLSTKIITPYYGTTLYVWSSVLGITLLGLALGYYIGANFIEKDWNLEITLFFNIWLYGILVLLIRELATSFMVISYSWGLKTGAIIAAILIVLSPIAIIGTLTTILIHLITKKIDECGNVAGKIYATSTLGNLLAVFGLGFWIIPTYGINNPITIIALTAIIFTVIFIIYLKKPKHLIALAGITFLTFIVIGYMKQNPVKSLATLKTLRTGILGQVSVLDVKNPSNSSIKSHLFINNITQSIALKSHPHLSLLPYIHKISILSSFASGKNAKALIIGYGAGHLASELLRQNFNLDAVEIDQNIYIAAKEFFFDHKNKCNFIIDDSRHFLKTTQNTYDLIITDVSSGEIQSSYNFTYEAFTEMKRKLNSGGIIITNVQGYIASDKNIVAQSIYKTIKAAGFDCNIWYLNNDKLTDIIFVSKINFDDFTSRFQESKINFCCYNQQLLNPIFREFTVNSKDAFVLYDDKPFFQVIALPISEEARTRSIESYIKNNLEVGIPIF